jgi:hypothetical protein
MTGSSTILMLGQHEQLIITEAAHGKNTDHHRYYHHHHWSVLAITTKIKFGPTTW